MLSGVYEIEVGARRGGVWIDRVERIVLVGGWVVVLVRIYKILFQFRAFRYVVERRAEIGSCPKGYNYAYVC